MTDQFTSSIEATDDGFVYVISRGSEVRPASRLWATEDKAKQAGEDYAHFLNTGEAKATPVAGTASLKG